MTTDLRECSVCYGKGWVITEDAAGTPTGQVSCPYCHGQRDDAWVAEKQAQANLRKRGHRRIVWTAVGILVAYGFLPIPLMLCWLAWVALAVAWFKFPLRFANLPLPALPAREHAPGFTDDRERTALGIFALGATVRSWFGQHHQGP
jgi:hypothetical protein